MKHAYTRRSNVNSKAQANMHTSRNNRCNPDMQCSNTWTMDTSHDCKSDAKSITNWVLLERLGEQAGFQLWLKWGMCLCAADGERQIIPGYGTLIGERSLARVFLSEPQCKQRPWSAVPQSLPQFSNWNRNHCYHYYHRGRWERRYHSRYFLRRNGMLE